ncbi:hypothetical protein L6260_01815 [Candidatus Parcubacteria bacterium]|nr:hypothetical protein [Candidatus Parcubacteria bacterium]
MSSAVANAAKKVALEQMREGIERIVGDQDVSEVLADDGEVGQIARFILSANPGALGAGLNFATEVLGDMVGKKHKIAGVAVEQIGEGVAHGLRDLARKAQAGQDVTVPHVETALKQAGRNAHALKYMRSNHLFKYLTRGQIEAFFALLHAAREEQHFDNTPASAMDQGAPHGNRFRGLTGRAFQLEAGLLWAVDNDPALMQKTLPHIYTYDQVYMWPDRYCRETITAAITAKFMPWQRALDSLDLMVNVDQVSGMAREKALKLAHWVGNIANAVMWGYPIAMIGMLAIFFVCAASFLASFAFLLFSSEQWWGVTLAWVVLIVVYLGLVFFRYTFSLFDSVHAVAIWIASQFDFRLQSSLLGSILRMVAGNFGKEEILRQIPGPGKKIETSWAVHFAGTVLIAASIIFAIAILHSLFRVGMSVSGAEPFGLAILFILTSVELARRIGQRLGDDYHQKTALFTIRGVTRVAIVAIAIMLGASVLGYDGVSRAFSWMRPGPAHAHEVMSGPTPHGLTLRQMGTCAYFKKFGNPGPYYCK